MKFSSGGLWILLGAVAAAVWYVARGRTIAVEFPNGKTLAVPAHEVDSNGQFHAIVPPLVATRWNLVDAGKGRYLALAVK